MAYAVVILATALVFCAFGVALLLLDRRQGLTRYVGSRVVIHTEGDQSVSGVLSHVYRDSLLLRAPKVDDDGNETGEYAEVGVLRDKVEFWTA